jgi:hypothetical protein
MELLPKVPPDVAERKGSPKPPGYPEDPFVRPRPGPALPELRFEHGYLLSIRPFIKPVEVSGELAVGQKEVIYGVPVSIQWRQVAWVTVRDQVSNSIMSRSPTVFDGSDRSLCLWCRVRYGRYLQSVYLSPGY